MKKIIFALVLILSAAGQARAQLGQRVSVIQNAMGEAIPNIQVTACAYNAGSYIFTGGIWTYTGPVPCTPTVAVFADPGGANPLSPVLSSGNGNYSYWVSPANYTECVAGAQINTSCYAVQIGGIGGGGGGGALPAAPGFSLQFANPSASAFASVPGLVVDSFITPSLVTFPLSVSIKGPRPYVDVTAYGAKGDGATDDTIAIQNAINAACSAGAGGGGTIFFPPAKNPVAVYHLTQTQLASTAPVLTIPCTGLHFLGGNSSTHTGASFVETPAVSLVVQSLGASPNDAAVFGPPVGGSLNATTFENLIVVGYNQAFSITGNNIGAATQVYFKNVTADTTPTGHPHNVGYYVTIALGDHWEDSACNSQSVTQYCWGFDDTLGGQPVGLMFIDGGTLVGCGIQYTNNTNQIGSGPGSWFIRNLWGEVCNTDWISITNPSAGTFPLISDIHIENVTMSDSSAGTALINLNSAGTLLQGVTFSHVLTNAGVVIRQTAGTVNDYHTECGSTFCTAQAVDASGNPLASGIGTNGQGGREFISDTSLPNRINSKFSINATDPAPMARFFAGGNPFSGFALDSSGPFWNDATNRGYNASLQQTTRQTLDVAFANLLSPTAVTGTPTTGGSLAANTYFAWVASTNDNCTTISATSLPSAPIVVGGANNAITVGWTLPPAGVLTADGYCVSLSTSTSAYPVGAVFVAGASTVSLTVNTVPGGQQQKSYNTLQAVHRFTPTSLGINNTSPSFNLDVTGTGRFTTTVTAANFISAAANPASAGTIRLATADSIGFRNNANSGNILITHNTNDQIAMPAELISGLAGGGVQCMQVDNNGVVGVSGSTCAGGGGGSSIFTQWQFFSNTALASTGLYIQLTGSAFFGSTQTGAGTIGSPYIDTLTVANAAGGTVFGNNTGGSAVPAFSAAPVLGIGASVAGSLGICNGSASGACTTIQNLSTTVAWNFNLPATAGTTGFLLQSQGGGSNPDTWLSPVITINGTPCTVGASCIPIQLQTNTVNNASQGLLNLVSSSSNTIGLSNTLTNTGTGVVKSEIAGLLNSTGGGTGIAAPTAHSLLVAEGINAFNLVTSPAVNGFYVCGFNVFASAAVDPTCTLQGIPIVVQAGATPTLTAAADVTVQQFTSGSAQAVTGPALASNITFALYVTGAGGVTYTPATGNVNGVATQAAPKGSFCFEYTDNTNTQMPCMPTYLAFPNTTANQALTFNSTTNAFTALGNIAIGPASSTNGDLACWNGTSGLLLSDCGVVGANVITSASVQTSGGVAIGGGTTTLGAPLAAAAADDLVTSTAAGTWASLQVNGGADCGDATHAIKWTHATHLFGCQAITVSASAGGNVNTIQWNNAAALGGIVQWTTNGTTTITGAATAVLDLSAMAPASGLKLPSVAGAIPTADGFIGFNTTIHALVIGSNGTTIVEAAAGTGTTTATTCTNQFFTVISAVAAPTCTTATLASAQFANQGTTTTVLHGNGAGNPAFGAVSLTADVSGILPIANGGTNASTLNFSTLTDGATVTWAIASVGIANAGLTFTVHSGSRTLNITNPVNGGSYVLWIKQDGTGGEGLTLGTGCTWKVQNGGAGAVTPSVTASAIDVLAFTYDGTNCYATFSKNFN